MEPRLSVVIPAYNDQAGLDVVLPRVREVLSGMGVPAEIVVVDDGSDAPLAERGGQGDIPLRLLRHPRNRGYGAAIKTGLRAAAGAYALIMDADNQHDPADIPRFYARAQACDMVVGLRRSHRSSPLWRRPGKLFLAWFLNSMSRTRIPDINCGFRCVRRDSILPLLDLCSDAFSFSLSSTVLLLNRGGAVEFQELAVGERIGISTVRLRSGLETAILIIRLVVYTAPLRFILPVSVLLFVAGAAWTTPYALAGRGVSVGGLLLMVGGMLAFFCGVLADQFSQLLRRGPR